MMKRYLTMLMALVAIATGAKADDVIYYGLMINGSPITSNYVPNPSSIYYYYDRPSNILHLKQWPGKIEVDGNVNPDLKISVEGEILKKHNNDFMYMITFSGHGEHVVYGNSSIHLMKEDRDNTHLDLGHNGIIFIGGGSHVTFKDLDITLESFIRNQPIKISGFQLWEGYLTLDHCKVSINTNGEAFYNTYGGQIELKNCSLVEGTNTGTNIVDANGNDMTNVTIVRDRVLVDTLAYEVETPAVGKVLHNTAVATKDGYSIAVANWLKVTDDNNSYLLEDGYVCQLGETYRIAIGADLLEDYYFPADAPLKATVNSEPAEIRHFSHTYAYYTFPQLANTYYDVWVGGKQVNDFNQKDVLGDGGSVKYSKTLGFHSLTLENANITNTGNPDYEFTGYGRGIYTTMPNLTIRVKGDNTIESKGEGIYFSGNLSILGITDNQGTLSVKGSFGIRPYRNSEEKTLTIGGVDLTAEGTSGAGIGASASFSSGNYNCTMKVGSAKTVVKAKGTSVSLGNLKSLVFEDGLQIVQPSGAYFDGEDVRNTSGIISNQWVVIKYNPSIATGLEAIDNGELTIDSSLPLYNLHGQRINHPVKGQIYIQNGRKIRF